MEDKPLDDVDAAILGELRGLYDETDPVPEDLVERVKFSLALDEMFEEVAAMHACLWRGWPCGANPLRAPGPRRSPSPPSA